MDGLMTDVALASMRMSSADQAVQYTMGMMRRAMDAESQEAAQLLEMLPQQGFQVSGPQPGDIPAIPKGSILDIYA